MIYGTGRFDGKKHLGDLVFLPGDLYSWMLGNEEKIEKM